MKSFEEIRRSAEKGDYQRIAELVGQSVSLVKMVVYEERTDHHHIQKIFSEILSSRERIAAREQRRREREAARLNAKQHDRP